MVRTKPLDDDQAEEKVKVPNAWKIATYISFVVIIGLVVLNIVRGGNILKPGMIQSLVILPFDNETGDQNLDFFVSGMHSSLIADVGKIGSLRVISKTTSDVYKNAHKSLSQIASELNVDAVAEAQVMCIGDSLCLQFRIVKADKEEKQIWAGDYHEDKRKILGLYNQITKQIAGEVKVKLSPEEEDLLSKSMIVNGKAYDACMKGNYYLDKFTMNDFDTALKYFELARELDPKYAPAYGGISAVWHLRQQGGFVSPADAIPKIREYNMKALELDNTYNLAGWYVYVMFDWENGEKEYKKAIKLNPNDAGSRATYSLLLCYLGRNKEALKQMEIAAKLDPLNPLRKIWHGEVLQFARRYDEAIKMFQDILKVEKDYPLAHGNLLSVFQSIGKYDEALEQFKLWVSADTELVNALVRGNIEGGYRGALLAYNKVAELRFKNSYWSPFDIGSNYAFIGEKDKAFYWLDIAYKEHNPQLPFIRCPYVYDYLHDDPRFQDLCRKMNLPYK